MADLWINYRDEDGNTGRVRLDRSPFTIGRHSACSLAVPNNKLSREHLMIERSGDRFFITDRGSSNGTELNSRSLIGSEEIMDRDRANLGGGLAVEFEYSWDEPEPIGSAAPVNAAVNEAALTVDAPPLAAAEPVSGGGFPLGMLILGPLAALILLVGGIGLLFVFGGGSSSPTEISERPTRVHSTDPDDPDEKPASSKSPSSANTGKDDSDDPTPSVNAGPSPPPSNVGENAKLEQNAAAFLRKIAQNDPTAFLTADQSKTVAAKVKQLSGSSSLADNFNSAKKSASQIKALATAKNLPPQLLATAALTKLGSSKGDILQTSQTMADILEKLQTQIGSERSDDSLMMVAAYDQGQTGNFQGLRNTLQDLATKFPESSRAIRSIWFLQKQNKITDAEFDFALRFLAIGIISQSPKDFGVNADPLTF
jgi:hypothetical protein